MYGGQIFSGKIEDRKFFYPNVHFLSKFFVSVFFGSALESILSSVKSRIFRHRGHFYKNRGQFLKIEDKLKLSEDRGQTSKIEDSPLKNQADGQPMQMPIK